MRRRGLRAGTPARRPMPWGGRIVHLDTAGRRRGGESVDLLAREVVAESDRGDVLGLVPLRQRVADGIVVKVDLGQAQEASERDHVAEQLLAEVLGAEGGKREIGRASWRAR